MALPGLSGVPDQGGADCVACGRCCHHGPHTVHFLVSDEERFGEERLRQYTELVGFAGYRFMVAIDDHCAALDCSVPGRFPCAVYEHRPDDCRDVAPGSVCCLNSRHRGRLSSTIE
jgi:Fe-S-cluster containining protein